MLPDGKQFFLSPDVHYHTLCGSTVLVRKIKQFWRLLCGLIAAAPEVALSHQRRVIQAETFCTGLPEMSKFERGVPSQ